MNEQEIQQTAELLKKLDPGFVPYPIFEQVSRIFAMPVYELIPLRKTAHGDVEVLLIDRGPHDPLWPNMLHTPGTIVRATDTVGGTQSEEALQRLLQDELRGTSVSEPQHFGQMLHQSKRGVEQAQLYWAEVLEEPRVGKFYSVTQLPSSLIDSQVEFIRLAAEAFTKK